MSANLKEETPPDQPLIVKKRIHVRSRSGLHARPAALFVQVTNRFQSRVKVRKGKRLVDGKSIMGVLSLAVERGSVIEVTAEGPDARELILALEQILARSEVPTLVTITKHKFTHG